MDSLISTLHTGGYSCIIRNGETLRTFTQRGVADLYQLLTAAPDFLRGSSVADKVIGKGAAALMIKGGVRRVYADVISKPALHLLHAYGISVAHEAVTENIINRAGTGICPVEQRCLPLTDLDAMIDAISAFLKEQNGKK